MNHETSSDYAGSAIGSPQTTEALKSIYKKLSGRIIQIERQMAGRMTPREMSEARASLSSFYSFYSGQLADLEARRNAWWRAHRGNHTSDKACDREWDATEEGELSMRIRYQLKGLDKMISSLRTLLDVAQSELRNQL